MLDLLRSMRPKHWIKNVFVAAPLVFARKLQDPQAIANSIEAFLAYCLVASSIYLLNDYIDLDRDKGHPIKCKRALPSGRVSTRSVIALAFTLLIASCLLSLLVNGRFRMVLGVYFLMNLAYSTFLKQRVILDVMIIAVGFVLRVIAGSLAIAVAPSNWLLMCTFLLALFIGFGKRRHELLVLEGSAMEHREVLSNYSPYFLDQMISVVTASTVMSYALYTISPKTIAKFQTESLIFTTPFVLYGIFRYLYLVHQEERGGDPASIVFSDKPLLVNILLWGIIVTALIYH